jgi:hypothetical protein
MLLALAGCAADPPQSRIVSAIADPVRGTLDLTLSLSFSATQLQALDHGIPLTIEFITTPAHGAAQPSRMQLGYLPMARRYELRADGIPARHFASRVQLLAALDRTRLTLPAGSRSGDVYLRLDTSALPAPLRLPALFDPEWRLRSPALRWTAST